MKYNKSILILANILSDGKYYSLQYLSDHLKTNIYNIKLYIYTLKKWGLKIIIIFNRGYKLFSPIQLLDIKKISIKLKTKSIFIIPILDSTNQYLIDKITDLHSGDSCVAEYQTLGRGRYGKKWFSPFGANIYLSLYWSFKKNNTLPYFGLSLLVGVVVAEILKDLGAIDVKVKWPNDIYLYGRKLAGILIEIINNNPHEIKTVIGIGINLFMNESIDIINQSWINLKDVIFNIDRNILVAAIINKLFDALKIFESSGLSTFIQRWLSLDHYLNNKVKLLVNKKEIVGIEKGIDMHGRLLLEQNGIVTAWTNGEISLRAH